MKILITTFTYIPNKDGVAEACRVLAEELARRSWEVWVATSMQYSGRKDLINPTSINNVKIVDFDLSVDHDAYLELEKKIKIYQDFVTNGNFDVILNQCWEVPTTSYIIPVLPKLDAKSVMVSHGYSRHIYQWNPRRSMGIIKWIKGIKYTITNLSGMMKLYDYLIFLSPQKDWGRFFDHSLANIFYPDKIKIISNSVDFWRFDAYRGNFRKKYGIEEKKMILCIANYSTRKNQELALRSFREANVPGSVLVFIGSELNHYAQKVIKLDNKLKNSNQECEVIFLENLDRRETCEALSECDIFLLTAKAETQPIVLIEAMACKKPWVSTNTGCVSSMEGGIVCNGVNKISDAIKSLMESPTLSQELGEKGYKFALLNYDSQQNIKRYDQLFRSLF